MLGNIIAIERNIIKVKLTISIYDVKNIIGKHVIFESNTSFVGEIISINNNIMDVSLLGEMIDNNFYYGDVNKPPFNSKCRLITLQELDVIYGDSESKNKITIGKSFIYPSYNVTLKISEFFSNHFGILGNTGSGKSYSVAKIIQSIFYQANNLPYRSNFFVFDAYGEYQNVFNKIEEKSPNLRYKVYTTNLKDESHNKITIPFFLLGVDDIALLLEAEDQKQLAIIEEALKLVSIFGRDEELVKDIKNDIIARALLDIIFSNSNPIHIKTKVTSVLTKFFTKDLNLDTKLTEPGWTRTLRQCLYIDKTGRIADLELVCNYLGDLVKENIEITLPDGSYTYTIEDFAYALEFAILEEGILNSSDVFDYTNILKVRLNSLIKSAYLTYFRYDNFITKTDYIKSLLTSNDGKKVQIVNFNINYVDDRFAKTLVKIYSKWLFDFMTSLEERASISTHIILEESHRYVQNDNDVKLLGYNIFDRITKEGRKYGLLLGLISQRPSELSNTALSQCSNFLIFRMFHPDDIKYIEEMIPEFDSTMAAKLKTLHPGICLTFGNAFKLPILIRMDKPNPEPSSSNVDILNVWYIDYAKP